MKNIFLSAVTLLVTIAVTTPNAHAAKTDFETALYASKHIGELSHVWDKFLITQFFAVIVRNDSGAKTKDFRFSVFTNPTDKKYYVLISEHLDRLENAHSNEVIKVPGAQLVQMLSPELGIIIGGLETGAFVMPHGFVQKLRDDSQKIANPAFKRDALKRAP